MRISVLAIMLIVVLRMAIGWHLFYEGVWKIRTLKTSDPWTSAGYLKNSEGPLRDVFRGMAGDPDELDWLDSRKVIDRWTNWKNRFAQHYGLSDPQRKRLDELFEGRAEFTARLDALPAGIDTTALEKLVKYDAQNKRLTVGKRRLTAKELSTLLGLIKWDGPADQMPAEVRGYQAAVNDLFQRASKLGVKERVIAMLDQNPNLVGDKDQQFVGNLDKYRSLLDWHGSQRSKAAQGFEHVHSQKVWSDAQKLRAELVGPIKAMERELKSQAEAILSVDQIRRGPPKEPWTPLLVTDCLTISGLTCLGLLLIVGLFSRFAAVMAAVMLFSFYMAMPPWPGVPELPGPEHSLIVNKNLVEVMALLAIAAMPTGLWFGLDGVVRRIFVRKSAKAMAAA
jgi:uncharacterized membrane protein YphA (DoxX/SURF4 family)